MVRPPDTASTRRFTGAPSLNRDHSARRRPCSGQRLRAGPRRGSSNAPRVRGTSVRRGGRPTTPRPAARSPSACDRTRTGRAPTQASGTSGNQADTRRRSDSRRPARTRPAPRAWGRSRAPPAAAMPQAWNGTRAIRPIGRFHHPPRGPLASISAVSSGMPLQYSSMRTSIAILPMRPSGASIASRVSKVSVSPARSTPRTQPGTASCIACLATQAAGGTTQSRASHQSARAAANSTSVRAKTRRPSQAAGTALVAGMANPAPGSGRAPRRIQSSQTTSMSRMVSARHRYGRANSKTCRFQSAK